MKTKFNQELYNKIKSKKNEPLSSISQPRVKVIEKEKEKEKEVEKKGLSTPALDEGQIASSNLSFEEVTPHAKKCKTRDKGKRKVGASVWTNAGMALVRATEVVTPDELKEIFGVPSHKMVDRHIHKLIQVAFFHFFFSFILKCQLSQLVLIIVFLVAKCWERRCILPPNTWRMRRKPW